MSERNRVRLDLASEPEDVVEVLQPDQARQVLETCESMARPGTAEVLIRFKDRWIILGRTDWKDDVRTCKMVSDLGDQPCLAYAARIALGARVTADGFWVVDSFTDG